MHTHTLTPLLYIHTQLTHPPSHLLPAQLSLFLQWLLQPHPPIVSHNRFLTLSLTHNRSLTISPAMLTLLRLVGGASGGGASPLRVRLRLPVAEADSMAERRAATQHRGLVF